MSLALALMLASVGTSADVEGLEISSPHFTIVTEQTEPEGKALARQLEAIRLIFLDALPRAFGHGAIDPPEPIVVYAVRDADGMRRLLPSVMENESLRKPHGLFRRAPGKHYLVLQMDAANGTAVNAYHEYFHVISRAHWGRLPAWLEEGFATFWETTLIGAEDARVGIPHRGHLQALSGKPLVPWRILFTVENDSPIYTEPENFAAFYAQSWAVVHYLLLGDATGERRAQLFDYIHRLSSDEPPADAFEASFGELDTLTDEVWRHSRKTAFRLPRRPRPQPLPEGALTVRTLGPGEMLAYTGDFVVHGAEPERARPILEQALELAPSYALVHEGLGSLELTHGAMADALVRFTRAGELDSTSFLVHYYHAIARLRSRAPLPLVLASLERSLALNPAFAPTHLFMARAAIENDAHLARGLDSARAAAAIAPDNPSAHFLLGRLLLMTGDASAGLDSYRRALTLPFEDSEMLEEMGRAFLEREAFAAAALALERAVAIEPTRSALQRDLGRALLETDRPAEAVPYLQKAVDAKPEIGKLHHELATALERSGRSAEALRHFRTARELGYPP